MLIQGNDTPHDTELNRIKSFIQKKKRGIDVQEEGLGAELAGKRRGEEVEGRKMGGRRERERDRLQETKRWVYNFKRNQIINVGTKEEKSHNIEVQKC